MAVEVKPCVPVLSFKRTEEMHGRIRLPPNRWVDVPYDLARRLAEDANYEVDHPDFRRTRPIQTPGDSVLAAPIGVVERGIRFSPESVARQSISQWPSVVIAIAVYNCLGLLQVCMNSLKKTEYAGRWRVIWIDNGSTDPGVRSTLEELPRGERAFLPEPSGFSAAINPALHGADEDYYVLVNQDCEFSDPHWLSALMKWMELRCSCGIAGAKLLYPNGTLQHAGLQFPKGSFGIHRYKGGASDLPEVRDYEKVPAVTGCGFAVRASVWKSLGGLDEGYPFGNEDTDFCLRAITELGMETWYVPDCVVNHLDNGIRNSSPETSQRCRRWAEESEQRFRERWGVFLERQCSGEVVFLLPGHDADSERCRIVWAIANHFASCGQKTTVCTFDGIPPRGSSLEFAFETRAISQLGDVDTIVATGWETLGACRNNNVKQRFYLVASDESKAGRYLGSTAEAISRMCGGHDYRVLCLGKDAHPVPCGMDTPQVLDADSHARIASQCVSAILR